ncbi:MAG: alpha/beta fold hydrolase [Bacteroidales bacterium]|nr:alpha/beta fold hydrolase [Bacteroidales bacterium]
MHIAGQFIQGKGKPIPLNFTRVKVFPVKKPRRPQEPHKPYPYTEETVRVKNENASGVTLAGILTIPEGEGPFPAVILISGSGPNDRDATIFGHKVFLVLADYLTRQGIAVLRTDDRGSNQSTGDFNSADIGELASDVAALYRFLSDHPKINAHKIGVIGHSHGASVAPVATVIEPGISFAVLMAGSSACLADDLVEQTEIIYKQRGISELAIALNTKYLKAAFEIVKQDIGLEEAKQQFEGFIKSFEPELKKVNEKELRMLGLMPPLKTSIINSFMTPAMKKDLFFQPNTFLEKMTCPTLILHGSKDVQVPVYHLYKTQQLIRSNGNSRVKAMEFKDKNHLFQSCETCTVSEYKEIEETMSPEVLDYIITWVFDLYRLK